MMERCIDLHTHIVPASFPSNPGAADLRWPSMQHRECAADVIISGKVYRSVEASCWTVSQRLDAMAESGVSAQVLSPMPELLSYWLPLPAATLLCEHLNAEIARMVADAPGRFYGLGAVTLQAPEVAARQLEQIVRGHGLQGVEIGTHVNGKPIGDASFEPFFAAAEALGAAVFVHPLRALGIERLVGPPALEQVVGFPCETSFAVASLMTGGMLERHPRLKLAFSHGGGAFGLVLPRLQHGWSVLPALRAAMPQAPTAYAARLSFDTLVYDRRTLRFLVEQFGAARLIVGSDYPFTIAERQPLRFLEALGLDRDAEQAIASGNARAFLGLA
ncbi:MAG: amidohydrolase family protein [Stellaceae bacterium]